MRASTELQTVSAQPSRHEGRCDRMNLSDWYAMLRAYAQREEGQTMAEYGVVLAVITIGVVVALGALALAISGKLGDVKNIISPPAAP
jgi:Flp pilus assembly pilin Flp